jgi:cytidine deaminase
MQRENARSFGGMGEPTTDDDLIAAAEGVLRPHVLAPGRLSGDVAAAVLDGDGDIHFGISIDTFGWGLCAERSAVAAMATTGRYRFRKVVAVWCSPITGQVHIVPPCGICREFMRQVDEANMDAEIILGRGRSVPLRELLPALGWPVPPQDAPGVAPES